MDSMEEAVGVLQSEIRSLRGEMVGLKELERRNEGSSGIVWNGSSKREDTQSPRDGYNIIDPTYVGIQRSSNDIATLA